MVLPLTWELPDSIYERFGRNSSGRQRAMVHEGHLVLVLHKLPDPETGDSEAVFFWRKPDGNWEVSERGSGLDSLRMHMQTFEDEAARLKKLYREAKSSQNYFHLLERVAPIHRVVIGLHQTLQAAREGIRHDRDIIGYRDWSFELEKDFEDLNRDTRNALDYSIARQTEEQAKLSQETVRAGHRLNILAATFLPITAISSVFGMNLAHGITQKSIWAFWGVLVMGVILGVCVRSWVLNRRIIDELKDQGIVEK